MTRQSLTTTVCIVKGQLEIVLGGWVMNDPAVTYNNIIVTGQPEIVLGGWAMSDQAVTY